jgi:hypothetical protein
VGALLILLSAVAAPSAAQADGAGYFVGQCWGSYRATPNVDDQEGPAGSYLMLNRCMQGPADLEITNAGGAVLNQGGQFVVTAPLGTTIREIHVDANLRRGSGHRAEIAVYDGSSVIPLVVGPDSNPQWTHYDFGGLNVPQLVLRLYCSNGNCASDGTAHLYARNIVLRLSDESEPSLSVIGGSLIAGGWQRGSQSLTASASDLGAGVSALTASVNGTVVAMGGGCDTGGLAFPYTGPIVPCQGNAGFAQSVNTAAPPFQNGPNTVSIVAGDYPGNSSGTVERAVLVDNAPPALAFTNEQDPNSPETIRADVSDVHSGIAAAKLFMRPVGASDWQGLETKVVDGQARAQVDSGALPAGDYEFQASASDIAGNTSETTRRADGDPMTLTFPLTTPVELRAHLNRGGSKSQVVRYGSDAKAKGLLLDSAGEPIAGAAVTVVEHFGAGALLRERVSQVTTDEKGKWRSKIPGGPSRNVEATYAGNPRFSSASKGVGTFLVRSRASLTTSRDTIPEGKTLHFKGRVRHFGARIPAGGKLVELQVRIKTGRWQTVGESFRTNKKGAYRRSYRFGKQYTEDALFRFRLKVKREANWPYKRTSTGQRKVVVRAG